MLFVRPLPLSTSSLSHPITSFPPQKKKKTSSRQARPRQVPLRRHRHLHRKEVRGPPALVAQLRRPARLAPGKGVFLKCIPFFFSRHRVFEVFFDHLKKKKRFLFPGLHPDRHLGRRLHLPHGRLGKHQGRPRPAQGHRRLREARGADPEGL